MPAPNGAMQNDPSEEAADTGGLFVVYKAERLMKELEGARAKYGTVRCAAAGPGDGGQPRAKRSATFRQPMA